MDDATADQSLRHAAERDDPLVLDWLLADTSGMGAWLAEHPTDPPDPVAVRAFVVELVRRAPVWLRERQLRFMVDHWPGSLPEDDTGPGLLP